MSGTPVQASIKMKRPSIERFLGDSHEQFVYGADCTTSSLVSTQDPGNEDGVPTPSNTIRLSPTSLDVFKSVPMPRFPIRVFNGKPPRFSIELQKRKIRWRYDWLRNVQPHCIQDPEVSRIQQIARPYIKSIDPEAEIVSVDLLARGLFNLAYNITADNVAQGTHHEYIFRVSLPIWPYYKVESDVATTEFVRHSTSIPVPIIYAFDSNPNNNLGFEWMLMEKVQGTPLSKVWDNMKFDSKQSVIRKLASWMAELSRFEFSEIGSIFMRYRQSQMEFYIGPAIHERLFEGDRLLHQIDRGPFQSIQDLYNAVLDLKERQFNNPILRVRHALKSSMSKESDIHGKFPGRDISPYTHQLRPDSEEAIMARADAEDQENEEASSFSEKIISRNREELCRYRILLPKLCALLPASETLTTMLTHPDLLPPNIFVDNAGVPIALIDWEKAILEPIALVDVIPRFLDENGESNAFYAPPGISVTNKEKSVQVCDYDSLASIRGTHEWTYEQLMKKIQRTRLRAVYQNEMKRLKSPMYKAFDRDPKSFEQELMRRVYWPENPGNTDPDFWAEEYLGESNPDDSDDEQEGNDREKTELDG